MEPLLIHRGDGATPHVASEHRDLLLETGSVGVGTSAAPGRTGAADVLLDVRATS